MIDITRENRALFYNPGKRMWFEEESKNVYSLHCDLDYILQYCRFGYGEDGIEFCDPSGGPMMYVGNYKINGRLVDKIEMKDKKILFHVSD